MDSARVGESAHPEASVVGEREAEPVAESRGAVRVGAGPAHADPGMDVIGVPDLLVGGVEGIVLEVARRKVLRRDDAGDAVVRANVEVSRMLEVVVDHAHDGPRLVVMAVVRVAQVVAVDGEAAVGLQHHLVHLAHVRPGVDVGVRARRVAGVGVVEVVADEAFVLAAALDQREVGRLGVARPDVQPVLRGVAAEDARARRQHIERLGGDHPEVFGFVDRGGDGRLEQTLRRAIDRQRRRRQRAQAEPADLVRVGAGVHRTRIGNAGVGSSRVRRAGIGRGRRPGVARGRRPGVGRGRRPGVGRDGRPGVGCLRAPVRRRRIGRRR